MIRNRIKPHLPKRRDQGRPTPRGFVLVLVLATLFVVMLLSSSLTTSLLADRRASRMVEQRQQTLWLLESAARRALYLSAGNSNYRGETWSVPARELNGRYSGQATIRVESAADSSTKVIRIVASYPQESIHRTTLTRELRLSEPFPGD